MDGAPRADLPKDPDFLVCFSRGFLSRLLLCATALLLLFYVGNVVLVGFAGVLLAVVLEAAVQALTQWTHLSQPRSYLLLLLLITILGSLIVYSLGPHVLSQGHEIAAEIPSSLGRLQGELVKFQWGRDVVRIATHAVQSRQVEQSVATYGTAFVNLLSLLVVIVVLALFLASHPATYRTGALLLVPAKHRSRAAELLSEIAITVRRWVIGQLIPMAVLGLGTLLGLWLLGIRLAFTLALFTSLMLFIPYVGSVMAFIPTALIALVGGVDKLLYVTCLYVVIHIAEGYVITPLAQRRVVHLPPALTVVSQLLMWSVGGLLGLAVATPLAAVVLVIVRKLYLGKDGLPES